MKLFFLTLFPLFINAFFMTSYKKTTKNNLNIKMTTYEDYNPVWDAGEVEWDFKTKDNYFNGFLEYNNVQSSIYNIYAYDKNFVEKNENILSLNENNFVNTIVLNAIFSGIGKALYNEFIRIDSVVLELNDFFYDNYSGNNLNNDLLFLSLSFILSINYYSKNKNVTYNKIDNMKEYLKIRRTTAIMFFILFTIMTKNVQYVD